jgi:hypothetical protein
MTKADFYFFSAKCPFLFTNLLTWSQYHELTEFTTMYSASVVVGYIELFKVGENNFDSENTLAL